MSEYIAVACIGISIVLSIAIILYVWSSLHRPTFQDRQIWNPTTRSWVHIPDHDQPFPMLTPIDEDGHQGRKYYREKYRRLNR